MRLYITGGNIEEEKNGYHHYKIGSSVAILRTSDNYYQCIDDNGLEQRVLFKDGCIYDTKEELLQIMKGGFEW